MDLTLPATAFRRATRTLRHHLSSLRHSWPTTLRELRAESSLRRAFANNQLQLFYEPIVSLTTHQTVGFEALTRIVLPDGTPSSFGPHVAVAESSGLILPIGARALLHACQQLASWHRSHPHAPNLWISVNVSAHQLSHPSFLPTLKEVLSETRIPPDRLKLELTESAVMQSADEPTLWKIKDLGPCLHMDDFGTGYSSLASLHRFPLDVLKVDRSFIRHTSACRDYAPVLHAIVALAHNLGLDVVAEGIETPTQLALLRTLSCDYAQGYHFSHALPAHQATHLLPPAHPTPHAQSA